MMTPLDDPLQSAIYFELMALRSNWEEAWRHDPLPWPTPPCTRRRELLRRLRASGIRSTSRERERALRALAKGGWVYAHPVGDRWRALRPGEAGSMW